MVEDKQGFIEYAKGLFRFLGDEFEFTCEEQPSAGDYNSAVVYRNDWMELKVYYVGFRHEGGAVIRLPGPGIELELSSLLEIIADDSVRKLYVPPANSHFDSAFPYTASAQKLKADSKNILTNKTKVWVEITKRTIQRYIEENGSYMKNLLDMVKDIRSHDADYSLEEEIAKLGWSKNQLEQYKLRRKHGL